LPGETAHKQAQEDETQSPSQSVELKLGHGIWISQEKVEDAEKKIRDIYG